MAWLQQGNAVYHLATDSEWQHCRSGSATNWIDWSGEGVVFLLAGCWQDCNFLLIVCFEWVVFYLMLQITVCVNFQAQAK